MRRMCFLRIALDGSTTHCVWIGSARSVRKWTASPGASLVDEARPSTYSVALAAPFAILTNPSLVLNINSEART